MQTAYAYEVEAEFGFAWVNDSTFGASYGDLVSVDSDGLATVRLHLEDDHPAVQDAVADGHSADQAEFHALVRWDTVQDQFGSAHRGVRKLYDFAQAKQAAAEEAEHRARIDAAREELRSGARKRAFSELDGNLRTR